MPGTAPPLPAGPLKTITLDDGFEMPYYVIPFDKNGVVKAPATRDSLLEDFTDHTGDHAYTDVYLFSHGWNNDWQISTQRYDDFLTVFQKLRSDRNLTLDRDYRPIMVGIFWPSTALVLPGERAPDMAAGDPEARQAQRVDDYLAELGEIGDQLTGHLSPQQLERFFALAHQEALDDDEAKEFAGMLAPLYDEASDPDEADGEPVDADALVESWRLMAGGEPSDGGGGGFVPGFVDDTPARASGDSPDAAFLKKLDPRGAVRAFTVWKMKDRAGTVGTHGVGPLLRGIKERCGSARIHLLGHSFGAKIVMSALVSGDLAGDGKVDSVLLLQPAINGFAFSGDVDHRGFPGGFHPNLDRSRLAILSTFSKHDAPLTKLFQFALRRKADLGEVRTAAGAPSKYAALGGFGPQGLAPAEGRDIDMPAPGTAYDLGAGAPKLYGVKGDRFIDGHSGIVNEACAWALWSQVAAN